MRKTLFTIITAALLFSSCSLDDFFDQPTVTVNSYELLEPPGSEVRLMMECNIKNNDSHDGDVKSIVYTVTLEGVESKQMTNTNAFTMNGGATITTNLAVTFTTSNALPLLLKIAGGQPLSFSVNGKFRADTFLGMKTLTLDTSGSSDLTVDLDDFFLQPVITMDESAGFVLTAVSLTGGSATIAIDTTYITNLDSHSATVIQVDYQVDIEGAQSKWMSTNLSSPIAIAASGDVGDSISMNDLPITYSAASGITTAIGFNITQFEYPVAYTITGKVLLESDLGDGAIQFWVPLNTSGSNTVCYVPNSGGTGTLPGWSF